MCQNKHFNLLYCNPGPIKNRNTLDITFVSDNITVERGFYIEYFIVGGEMSYPRIDGEGN